MTPVEDHGPSAEEKAELRRRQRVHEEVIRMIRSEILGIDPRLARVLAGAVAFEGMPLRLLCRAVVEAKHRRQPAQVLVERFNLVGLPYTLTSWTKERLFKISPSGRIAIRLDGFQQFIASGFAAKN